MKFFFIYLSFLFAVQFNYGQNIIKLWTENIPNQRESEEVQLDEVTDKLRIFNVQDPTLEVYLPSKGMRNGMAMIICPGGGYRNLSYHFEGTDFAKFLNSKGIATFVLKYRLPDSKSLVIRHQAPLQDAQRAIRYIRFNANKYDINPNKIGIMGFSAGGHLASTLGTHYDREVYKAASAMDSISARPDFLALAYAVITMKDPHAHKGSRRNLLGNTPTPELIDFYSNETKIDANTPPTFLVHASNDSSVPVINSILFYEALQKNGVSAEIHIYPEGGHGFGLALKNGYLQTWTDRLVDWLEGLNSGAKD
ncbi:alpha/beta hydrolase [Gaetbulibacter sp. M240]|uniref:alpha/beta hydrolase n=1 Tax=Gaetbulibacter sp. M240 TaxID=3126511 RepID=UPI00374EA8C6